MGVRALFRARQIFFFLKACFSRIQSSKAELCNRPFRRTFESVKAHITQVALEQGSAQTHNTKHTLDCNRPLQNDRDDRSKNTTSARARKCIEAHQIHIIEPTNRRTVTHVDIQSPRSGKKTGATTQQGDALHIHNTRDPVKFRASVRGSSGVCTMSMKPYLFDGRRRTLFSGG